MSISELKKPQVVAVNQRGEFIVAEVDSSNVSVFSRCGKRIRSFGTPGSDQGTIFSTSRCSSGWRRQYFSGNHHIQKFTAVGQFLAAVGIEGSGELEFTFPRVLQSIT